MKTLVVKFNRSFFLSYRIMIVVNYCRSYTTKGNPYKWKQGWNKDKNKIWFWWHIQLTYNVFIISIWIILGPQKDRLFPVGLQFYHLLKAGVFFLTALVFSDTACLANSPERRSLTAVWISLEVMVDLLL